jgi:hypothetical protein
VVDAWAAQHASGDSKPISVAFALIGLHLKFDCNLTGREVQRAHMRLARRRRTWPTFTLPAERGTLSPIDVMAASEGADRDRAIDAWCKSVWKAFAGTHGEIRALLAECGYDC